MKYSLLALLVFAFPVKAEEPKYYLNVATGAVELRIAEVENKVASLEQRVAALEKSKMPPLAEVKAELVKKAKPSCTCENCECGLAKAPATVVTTRPQVVKAPMDHTHTCSKGHTWDHSMDGGTHVCPFCSEVQMIQDRKVQATTTYSMPSSLSGGCANGQCASPNTGWYLGKRLGR